MSKEEISTILYMAQVLNDHAVITRNSGPQQLTYHPYAALIQELLKVKRGQSADA